MRGLTGYAVRSLIARPARTFLSVAAIALGVSVLFASLATSAGIDAAITRTAGEVAGLADLRVGAFQETGLGPDTVARIAETPGVAVAAAAIERRTFLGPAAFAPGDELPDPVTVLAIDAAREPAVRTFPLSGGRFLTERDALGVVISQRLAAEDGFRLGSRIVVQGAADTTPLQGEVVGILAGAGPVLEAEGRLVIVPLTTAASLFETEAVTRVDVLLADGATTADVGGALEQRLTREPYILTTADDVASSLRASTADFAGMTALIAAVTLFAGAFLIFNTLSMTVNERFREVGLLRAAGATRGQVSRTVLVQGAVLGLIGSGAGIVLGAVLAVVLAGLVGPLGAVQSAGPSLSPGAVAAASLAGMVVTLAAGVEPARRAGRISPVEALKPNLRVAARGARGLLWAVVVFAVVALVGLVLVPPAGGGPAMTRSLVVYVVLLGTTLVLPLLLPTLARVAGLPFAILLRLEERLARASLGRNPSRAALTIGALTVGVAMLVALGGLRQQARATAETWLSDVVPGDVVLTAIRPIPLEEGLGELLGALSGVGRVSPLGTFEVGVDGSRVDAAAVHGADLAADGRLTMVAGERAAALAALDAGGATILSERISRRLGATVGDTVEPLSGDGGTLALRVVGVAETTLPGRTGDTMLVGWTDATTSLGVTGADAFAVRFRPAATATERAALADEARALALDPTPVDAIRTTVGDALGRVFALFDALALVALIVAGLGIVNTLGMNVLERVREIGVLRAVGMTRRQVWRAILVEAGICGLAGALLGSLAGVVIAGLIVTLADGRPGPAGVVSVPVIVLAVVLGVALSMLAAAWPARIASGLPIVRAVRFE